jgi:D-alanine-D-alanine ligase
VETEVDFFHVIGQRDFDIVWSALYHISPNEKFIGRNEGGIWVADYLDSKGIPYIGSNSQTMKDMIDKYRTHTILSRNGVPVPSHRLVHSSDDLSTIAYPSFVKPICESRSVGISDESVVYSEEELKRRVAYIEGEFDQAALVEDYLPGDEYTTLVLGNGATRECLPGLVTVDPKFYTKHKILRSDLRGVGLTRIKLESRQAEEAKAIADKAAEAMHCLDHVRIDIKADPTGKLRIIEVNGIPGLKPHKSWAPQIYTLYHGSPETEMEDYRQLIRIIIDSARKRYGL